jgi:hypothetical protein
MSVVVLCILLLTSVLFSENMIDNSAVDTWNGVRKVVLSTDDPGTCVIYYRLAVHRDLNNTYSMIARSDSGPVDRK